MGFNNPTMPWSELERPCPTGRRRPDGRAPGSPAGTPAVTVRRGAASASRTSRRPDRSAAATAGRGRRRRHVPYAELHCHSNFSFLDGASHPEQLAEEADRLGLEALALTDQDGFYGVVRFAEAAKAVGLPTVFGAEITLGITRYEPGLPGSARRARRRPRRRPGGLRAAWRGRSASGSSPARRAHRGSARSTLAEVARAGTWWVLTGCRKGVVPAALRARRARQRRRASCSG